MTDAQHFFDLARTQFNSITADVERHFDLVASQLKEWIPSDPTSMVFAPPKHLPPPTTYQVVTRWMDRHRALTAAAVAFAVTGSVGAGMYVRSLKVHKKRRARKSANGARTEVVVLAGAVSSPLASALALDLERRGFVVYVVASSPEEEHFVRSLSRADLLPLPLTLTDPFLAQEQMARFQNLMGREHFAFESAEPHHLDFKGLVLVPDTASVSASSIESTSSEDWSDALNAKVLNTIATTQLFLPSLVSYGSRVLLLTPSITPALQPAGHAVESTIYSALTSFTSTLAAEMREQGTGVSVSQFKLGNLDIPSQTAKQRREGQQQSRLKATPLRKLHDSVFDALTASRPSRTWRVGRGSLAYDMIGVVAPPSVVGWMLGLGKRKLEAKEVGEEALASSQGSIGWETLDEEE